MGKWLGLKGFSDEAVCDLDFHDEDFDEEDSHSGLL